MNKKGVIDKMVIVISINFCSLDHCSSVGFLERVFDIHVNTQDIYETDFLQKIYRFWKKRIIVFVLESEFWRGSRKVHNPNENKSSV